MKFSNKSYEFNQDEYEKLQNRLSCFQRETGSSKAIHITLITANGLTKSKYSGIVQNIITGDNLFS